MVDDEDPWTPLLLVALAPVLYPALVTPPCHGGPHGPVAVMPFRGELELCFRPNPPLTVEPPAPRTSAPEPYGNSLLCENMLCRGDTLLPCNVALRLVKNSPVRALFWVFLTSL